LRPGTLVFPIIQDQFFSYHWINIGMPFDAYDYSVPFFISI